jgi:hypothetical protein
MSPYMSRLQVRVRKEAISQNNRKYYIAFNISTECQWPEYSHQKADWQVGLKSKNCTGHSLPTGSLHITDKDKHRLRVKDRKRFSKKMAPESRQEWLFSNLMKQT